MFTFPKHHIQLVSKVVERNKINTRVLSPTPVPYLNVGFGFDCIISVIKAMYTYIYTTKFWYPAGLESHSLIAYIIKFDKFQFSMLCLFSIYICVEPSRRCYQSAKISNTDFTPDLTSINYIRPKPVLSTDLKAYSTRAKTAGGLRHCKPPTVKSRDKLKYTAADRVSKGSW